MRIERTGQKPDRATSLQLSACPVVSRRGKGWTAAEIHSCVTAGGREEEEEKGDVGVL